jgi:hypothetical protein
MGRMKAFKAEWPFARAAHLGRDQFPKPVAVILFILFILSKGSCCYPANSPVLSFPLQLLCL